MRRKRTYIEIGKAVSNNSKVMSSGETRYKCPCCGNFTFNKEPCGDYDICPVCFWEDDSAAISDEDFEGGANKVSLKQAKVNYLKYGAVEERFIKNVRKPMPEEMNET